jgi:hypothetical protein
VEMTAGRDSKGRYVEMICNNDRGIKDLYLRMHSEDRQITAVDGCG